MTPEQEESLNECRRMLGVMLGWNPAADTGEADAVTKVWGEGDSVTENRRMIGVILGWNPPANDTEWDALALVWGSEQAVADRWGDDGPGRGHGRDR